MRTRKKTTDKRMEDRSACTWRTSTTRWLMENYDIWSATPARGCDQPARPLSFK